MVASLLLFLCVCTGSSTMTTLHSDCHSVSSCNGWEGPLMLRQLNNMHFKCAKIWSHIIGCNHSEGLLIAYYLNQSVSAVLRPLQGEGLFCSLPGCMCTVLGYCKLARTGLLSSPGLPPVLFPNWNVGSPPLNYTVTFTGSYHFQTIFERYPGKYKGSFNAAIAAINFL